MSRAHVVTMRFALPVAILLAYPWSITSAADLGKARDHYAKGTRAYELGLWDEAIAEYMAAYKEKDDPALLFNLGQAHRLAGHPSEALRFYKTYLSKVPGAANRAEVETKMRDLSALIEKERTAAAGAPSPVATAATGGNPPGEPATARADGSAEPPAAPATTSAAGLVASPGAASLASDGAGKRWTGIAVGAAGLALVGTGIVFGVLAKQAGDDLTELDRQQGVFDPGKESAGRRDQFLEAVFIGTGIAALAGGTVLYVLGLSSTSPAPAAVAVTPTRGGNGAAATLRVAF